METSEKWGRRIRAFRKLKGYTQEKLAKELLVSVSILGEIERGNRVPSDEIIDSIVRVLNISREELDPNVNR
ncbi:MULTISPECIES: helix-turn-helix domain-containing protein [Niallia]|uniref:XRE family transcriptional regulator n=2 Tax=Niallia TaxID=2837506 RepID=A0A3S2UTI1_9BACI|nr:MULTISPECIES: helix-turn-helix transcriptional regulator [Niallia]MCM3218077.1 helix-turn-helix domain-containing protein [Niallia taxi]MCT2346800.1 helix-turn-helix domain-containing protein [Niallia taxi]MDE5055943.1 helix-turn-helix transcriptional regulator [Niallia taxi]MDK8643277.1 helix-turn-helix transcriptional regulator [Niallia taxi]MED3965695.1 helix-turn-helix transcriptional regulator [Niallia taxi]